MVRTATETPPPLGSSLGRPFTPVVLREERESNKGMKLVDKVIKRTNKTIDGGYVLIPPTRENKKTLQKKQVTSVNSGDFIYSYH